MSKDYTQDEYQAHLDRLASDPETKKRAVELGERLKAGFSQGREINTLRTTIELVREMVFDDTRRRDGTKSLRVRLRELLTAPPTDGGASAEPTSEGE